MTSDGEHQEGSTWEAVLLAAKYKLDNLVAICDRNYIQIDGNTEDIMPLGDLAEKYRAFGWHAITVDGHDYEALIGEFEEAKKTKGRSERSKIKEAGSPHRDEAGQATTRRGERLEAP